MSQFHYEVSLHRKGTIRKAERKEYTIQITLLCLIEKYKNSRIRQCRNRQRYLFIQDFFRLDIHPQSFINRSTKLFVESAEGGRVTEPRLGRLTRYEKLRDSRCPTKIFFFVHRKMHLRFPSMGMWGSPGADRRKCSLKPYGVLLSPIGLGNQCCIHISTELQRS